MVAKKPAKKKMPMMSKAEMADQAEDKADAKKGKKLPPFMKKGKK
jgi:hypothetical protein